MLKFDWYDNGSMYNSDGDLCGINWLLLCLNLIGMMMVVCLILKLIYVE
jgi:hypothetical protein